MRLFYVNIAIYFVLKAHNTANSVFGLNDALANFVSASFNSETLFSGKFK